MLYSYNLQPQNTMHNHIQKQIKENRRYLRSHLKTIITRANICSRSLDIHLTTPGAPDIPLTLIQDLHVIIDTATHAIHLAQLNNRLKSMLARHHPTPPQDSPPYRPSSPHLTTTPATLSN